MIPQKIPPSQTLALVQKVKDLKAAGEDIVSFAAGESDFDTPEWVIEKAYASMKSGNTRYVNTQGLPELRKALAKDIQKRSTATWVDETCIGVCAGAKQGIHLVLSAALSQDDEVLIPAPYWVSYPGIVRAVGAQAIRFETKAENGYFPTVEELKAKKTGRTKALIFASPNNPTGDMISEKLLKEIVDWCVENKILLIYDELYEKLVFSDKKHFTALSMVSREQSEWVVSLNAFSKAFSMTGWRLGYFTSHPENIKALSGLQSQVLTCLPGFVQEAGVAALERADEYLEPILKSFKKRRDLFMGEMAKVSGVKAHEPQAAFYVMVDVSEAMKKKGFNTDKEFVAALLEEKKVALNPASSFGVENQVRFTFSLPPEQIVEGIRRFREFVEQN
ncbi:pyridoxal phosphate-dependent aminotransferase [bacterium]|nr:pyridoxal phosphate-dependent aminotransferase [bacterium]